MRGPGRGVRPSVLRKRLLLWAFREVPRGGAIWRTADSVRGNTRVRRVSWLNPRANWFRTWNGDVHNARIISRGIKRFLI